MAQLKKSGVDKNTLILLYDLDGHFADSPLTSASDNGPWMVKDQSGGSEGLFTGRFSGYW